MGLGHGFGAAGTPCLGTRLRAALTLCAVVVAVSLGNVAVAEAAAGPSPVLVAAGDIACPPGSPVNPGVTCNQAATGALIQSLNPTAVAALGDEQYNTGAFAEFTGSFALTWGQFLPLIRPVPGNHEYLTPGASGYYKYFGAAAGNAPQGWYSYNLGSWHILALNSNCDQPGVSCTAEEQWLRADLAANTATCVMAYWHHPLFSSGPTRGGPDNLATRPFWQDLVAAGADVVLNGHDHNYERFAPQDASGQPGPTGIREFIVGTGGADHSTTFGSPAPTSQVHDLTSFGVLGMTLNPSSYSWQFSSTNTSFTDSGSAPCNDLPPTAVLSVSTTTVAAGQPVQFDATGSSDPDGGIQSAQINFGDSSSVAASTASHSYAKPGSYVVGVLVTDNGGQIASTTQTLQVLNPPAPPPPAPKKKVTLSLGFSPQTLAQSLRHALALIVTPSQSGRVTIVAQVGWHVAREVGLEHGRGRQPVTVASFRSQALHRRSAIKLVFTHAARVRLAHLQSVSLTLLTTFIASDGTRVTRSSTIMLMQSRRSHGQRRSSIPAPTPGGASL